MEHIFNIAINIENEPKKSVEEMRKDLVAFCNGQRCYACLLRSPVCRCGRGTHFLYQRGGGYDMSDDEIRAAWAIAFKK